MIEIKTGTAWPHGPQPDGMAAMISLGSEALGVMLACHVAKPTANDVKKFRQGDMRLAIWPSRPITWILADFGAFSLDAPYAVGISSPEHVAAIRASAEAQKAMGDQQRLVVTAALIDRGKTAALRSVTVSASWARVLADAILDGPASLGMAAYHAAIMKDERMSGQDMLRAATIIERGGRI